MANDPGQYKAATPDLNHLKGRRPAPPARPDVRGEVDTRDASAHEPAAASVGAGVKTCPACRLISPDSARACDCGHDFSAPQRAAPPAVTQAVQELAAGAAKPKMALVLGALAVAAVVIFGTYVWPTRYRYEVAAIRPGDGAMLVRVDRFRGTADVLWVGAGWMEIDTDGVTHKGAEDKSSPNGGSGK